MKFRIVEFFLPWRSLKRIERELDAEERMGAWKMQLEWWKFQEKCIIEEMERPSIFVPLLKGR